MIIVERFSIAWDATPLPIQQHQHFKTPEEQTIRITSV